MTERRCSWCGEPTDLRLVRRFFANNWHAVVQCDECLHQVGGSVSREKAGGPIMDLPEWDGSGDEPRATAASPDGSAVPSDAEAELRDRTIGRLRPWFDVREEVRVQMAGGAIGRIDVLAIPLDIRFRRFGLAIEVKRRLHVTSDLAKRIKQAADYVGATVLDEADAPPIVMAFIDLIGLPFEREDDRHIFAGSMQVAHQFRVGGLRERDDGWVHLFCGPDSIWREKRFGTAQDHWAGRAIERLTNTRQKAGRRG